MIRKNVCENTTTQKIKVDHPSYLLCVRVIQQKDADDVGLVGQVEDQIEAQFGVGEVPADVALLLLDGLLHLMKGSGREGEAETTRNFLTTKRCTPSLQATGRAGPMTDK